MDKLVKILSIVLVVLGCVLFVWGFLQFLAFKRTTVDTDIMRLILSLNGSVFLVGGLLLAKK